MHPILMRNSGLIRHGFLMCTAHTPTGMVLRRGNHGLSALGAMQDVPSAALRSACHRCTANAAVGGGRAINLIVDDLSPAFPIVFPTSSTATSSF
ncbi:hypothetical protein MTO96_019323 [Rhipicephalus appendiculatus]